MSCMSVTQNLAQVFLVFLVYRFSDLVNFTSNFVKFSNFIETVLIAVILIFQYYYGETELYTC